MASGSSPLRYGSTPLRSPLRYGRGLLAKLPSELGRRSRLARGRRRVKIVRTRGLKPSRICARSSLEIEQ
jgi:hypothetical protein